MIERQSEDADLTTILAYQSVHARLTTSGQPTLAQFEWIAQAGYKTVINLALTDASNAVAGEDRRVLELGMDYIHVPLLFAAPSVSQVLQVLDLLASLKTEQVWLHCALNMRVSSLMYLYRTHFLNVPADVAAQYLHQIWTPDEIWSTLIDQTSNHLQSH
jgi:protein tyrosine phosphatase (PTP) superfamily phosphohydrolase (DUF442 family)